MNFDDYKKVTLENAKDAIDDYGNTCDTWNEMFDELFIDDSVTGNGSGSYTMSTYQAKENTAELIWDDDAIKVFKDYGYDGIPTERGPEAVDVMARCLALDCLMYELEEYYNEKKESE